MWNRVDVKARGKQAFKGNYWPSVGAAFLLGLFVSGTSAASSSQFQLNGDPTQMTEAISSMPTEEQAMIAAALVTGLTVIAAVATVLRLLVFNPLSVGCFRFFRKNAQDPATPIACIGEGFQQYGHVVGTMLIKDLLIFLWSLLFVIPGIIKSYSYRMVPYIIKDRPELSATETIALSNQMMKGNKWAAFMMDLSFIGWFLLGIVTFNLGNIFWTNPYRENANAALYLELSKQ